jgi:YD repeat-containing protein
VRIGYVYPAVYYESAEFQNAFGAFGDTPLTPNALREEITSWQEWTGYVSGEPSDPRASGLGGWTLNVHHTYDPVGLRMSLGDGSNRDLNDRSDGSLAVYAGSGRIRSGSGDGTGGPAIDASLGLRAMAFGPDNSLYLAENFNGALGNYNEIRRISPDGIISLYAGVSREVCRAEDLPCGDGGPATETPLYFPNKPAFGPDGSLYFVDRVLRSPFEGYRIRRITPDGIIHTVGGNGQEIGQDPGRDGQPATDTALNGVNALAVGPDGSVYFNESQRYTIRRIAPDGTLSTIAGNGEICFDDCGEGIPARDARVGNIRGLAVDSENTIYFSEHNSIRRIRPDGIIETLATGSEQTFTNPERLHITSSNELLIIDGFRGVNLYPQIWTLAPDGTLRLVTETSFYNVRDALIGSDDVLYIGTRNQVFTSRSLRYRSFNSIELTIPNVDGSETYVFNGEGRHLRTVNSLTGAIRYRFAYDAAGRLSSITDGEGNVPNVERDGNGNPTAIVGPYGARTGLDVDANGYLNRITDPSGANYSAGYNGPGGLLTSFTTPLNQRSQMSYDSVGRLTSSTDAANQTWTLVRSDDFGNDVVTMTRPNNRTYVYRSEQSTNDDSTLINQFPDGSQAQLTRSASGSVDTTYRFGSSSNGQEGADPRWGTLTLIAADFELRSPAGISSQRSQSREVELANPSDPLSLIAMTDTVRLNGRTATSIYDAASRTQQVTSPAGRNASQTYDEQGRLLAYQLPGLAPENRSYDERGRLTRISYGSGNERSISMGYNAAGELASITDALGRTWALSYDQAGRVTSVTGPDNQVTRYTFDTVGNLTSLTPPGRPAHSFAYSPVNLLQSVTLPDVGSGPATTTYTYNANRQRTGISRPDGSQISYAYDAGGQLTTVTTPEGTTTYTYSDGNLATATTPDGVLSYRYDGHLTTEASWSGIINGSVQYTYGNGMRLSQQRVNNATRLAFQYDADGLLTQAGDLEIAYAPDSVFVQSTSLNQIGTTLNYDQYGSLGLYRATNGSATLFETSYTRDAIGRISSLRETIDGQTSTYAYTYDQAGRLTGVQRNGTSIAGYSYDPHGNRLSATDSNGTGNASYDNQDQLLS